LEDAFINLPSIAPISDFFVFSDFVCKDRRNQKRQKAEETDGRKDKRQTGQSA